MRTEAQIKTYDFFKFVPKQNKITTCLYFRKVRLDEVLEEVEKYCDSDEASDENEEQMNVIVSTKQIAVYISPPDNGGITDEDSGDEDTVTLANLPGNQITAAAEIKYSAPTSQTSHDRDFQSQTVKSRKARHWQKKDEDGQIILVRWCDNGVVSITSNQHGLHPIKRVERYCASEKKEDQCADAQLD